MSRVLFRLWQSNENRTASSNKHAAALSGPERVPEVIVNHQQRRRRNMLLSFRRSHALDHGCYCIIPPSTAMVNLFHYVATSVHAVVVFVCRSVCTCMLLKRPGFICTAARPEIKLGGLQAQSLPSHYSTQACCHSDTAAVGERWGTQGKINSKKRS